MNIDEEGIEKVKESALARFGQERMSYLLGLREGITICCTLYSQKQQIGDNPLVVNLAQFVDDQIDKASKDKSEQR